MHIVDNENNLSDNVITTEMYARGGSEFLWAGSILGASTYHTLLIWQVFTAFMAKGFTNIT